MILLVKTKKTMPDIPNKIRVSIVAIRDGNLLLIKRVKPDKTYYTFPGGTVEDNETPEEAVVREGLEELSHPIEIDRLLFEDKDADRHDYYFLIKDFAGEPKMGEPEVSRITEGNNYIYEWIPMNEIKDLDNFYIPDIRPQLLNWWNNKQLVEDIRNALVSSDETVGEVEYTTGNFDDKSNLIAGSIPTVTTDACEIGIYNTTIYFTFIIFSSDFKKELLDILPDNVQIYPFKYFNSTLYPKSGFNYSEFEKQLKHDKYLQINFNDNYKDHSVDHIVKKYFEYKELFKKCDIQLINQLGLVE